MMKRITGRLVTIVSMGIAAGLFAASGAWASDIVCKSTAREAPVRCNNPDGSGVRCNLATDEAGPRARPRHLICDSSRLSERYERIYAEQQRMLHKGRILDSDIAAWRSRRDACDSVRCLESMFAKFWRERDSMRIAPGRSDSANQAATARSIPASQKAAPLPAAASAPAPQAAQAPQTSTQIPAPPQHVQEAPPPPVPLATSAGPEPVEPTRPTAPAVEALPVWQGTTAPPVAENKNSSPAKPYPAALAVESLLSGLAVMGAGFLWTRRTARAQDRTRFAIPAAVVVVYGLLLVNALLLPFTLAVK
ncbi:GntR family transcriptional regulator [Cupriavidus necator]|uniref:GntR family transcriptional regulator n=1 Tax=Cupriavidus necator TaxID=106590 RepID=A0A367PKM6_CUPNE|nr:GntR family transcriptional regulator [Cupriavidus necator]QQX86435.1 GntR family transcriptional regulator [Cupriavidus necator]RCJ07566.1 GntR family transcriptional regulator [Cupriavidus necator]